MIPVYMIAYGDAVVSSLDDHATTQDWGVDFRPTLVASEFASAGAGGWARFRRFVQALHIGGDVTIDVTPIFDGSESATDKLTRSFSAGTDGETPVLDVGFAKGGSRHQVRVTIRSHSGRVALGEAEAWMLVRRLRRR